MTDAQYSTRIIGTGGYLPEQAITNADLEAMVNTSDEWIQTRTGIRTRFRIDDKQRSSDMALAAARQAMTDAHITPDSIDLIIVATSTPDSAFPAMASLIQGRLGIPQAIAFDISAACSGFLYALAQAFHILQSHNNIINAKCALIVGVDSLTRVVNYQDRSSCILFGDGAGALIIERQDIPSGTTAPPPGLLAAELCSSGNERDLLYVNSGIGHKSADATPPAIVMQGADVFRHAVQRLSEVIDIVLMRAGLTTKDIDWVIPHQANHRIIEAVRKKVDLPKERVINVIEHHGNTSAASIPLAFHHARQEHSFQAGQIALFEAFGAGLNWGSLLVRL